LHRILLLQELHLLRGSVATCQYIDRSVASTRNSLVSRRVVDGLLPQAILLAEVHPILLVHSQHLLILRRHHVAHHLILLFLP
jgi:hypothetical protein